MKWNLKLLRAYGFDNSKTIPFESSFRAGCSQCAVVCVNGTPCHETGCPNAKYTCKGCDEIIDRRGYCKNCQ